MKKIIYLLAAVFFYTIPIYAKTIRIMPLGDSVTYEDQSSYYGDVYKPISKRTAYRSHLWHLLKENKYSADFVGSMIAGQDISPKFDPDNEGHPGWTSYDISEQVYAYMEESKPDIVLLHIGTNDHSSRVLGVERILNEIDLYEENENTRVKVYVALIINRKFLDLNIVKFNSNLEDLIYTRINKNNDDLVLVNMLHDANLSSSDYSDNTHPNQSGYKKMANVWFSALNKKTYTPRLHAYPHSIVDKKLILSSMVDEDKQVVTFITKLPTRKITF